MDSDRQFIYDALQEKAREHADMVFFDIMEKYQSAPWNEFRDALADIFLAGAAEGALLCPDNGIDTCGKPGAEAPARDQITSSTDAHPETNPAGRGD